VFLEERNHKVGVREKVEEVIERFEEAENLDEVL